jgi:hypothetical protein
MNHILGYGHKDVKGY